MKEFEVRIIYPYTVLIIGPGGERCYLLEGKKRAVLIDTLIGAGELKKFCETITEKEIMVINTHGHLDHCGGNYEFDACWMHPADHKLFSESGDISARRDFVKNQTGKDTEELVFQEPRPVEIHDLADGMLIDLGGRELEVIHVPGHTAGTVVLLEKNRRVLFSGDACNKNTLLNLKGSVSVTTYKASLEKLEAFTRYFDYMYGGHEDAVSSSVIRQGIDLCDEIIKRKDDMVPAQREHQFYAKRKVGDYMRLDGLYVNIAYDERNI